MLQQDRFKSQTGTYALVFECRDTRFVEIGKLGPLKLIPGYYVYVGSAFGTGGIRARMARHLASGRRPHWHVDYIKPHCTLSAIWVEYSVRKCESTWARILLQSEQASIPLFGFGASDTPNASHLFYFSSRPPPALLPATHHIDVQIPATN